MGYYNEEHVCESMAGFKKDIYKLLDGLPIPNNTRFVHVLILLAQGAREPISCDFYLHSNSSAQRAQQDYENGKNYRAFQPKSSLVKAEELANFPNAKRIISEDDGITIIVAGQGLEINEEIANIVLGHFKKLEADKALAAKTAKESLDRNPEVSLSPA